jgi:hypothetical protein
MLCRLTRHVKANLPRQPKFAKVSVASNPESFRDWMLDVLNSPWPVLQGENPPDFMRALRP